LPQAGKIFITWKKSWGFIDRLKAHHGGHEE